MYFILCNVLNTILPRIHLKMEGKNKLKRSHRELRIKKLEINQYKISLAFDICSFKSMFIQANGIGWLLSTSLPCLNIEEEHRDAYVYSSV